jgi:DNA topoisomerase-1
VMEALNEMLGPHIFPPREDGADPRICPQCGTGRLSLKPGKFGPFIGCSNYKEEDGGCSYRRGLSQSGENELDGKILGYDPDSGLPVTVKSGRFGTYLQLGEQKDYEEGEKPRRSSIPKGVDSGSVDLEFALKLLNLPREVGQHPDGGTITAGLGRFGPFIVHEISEKEKTYVNLPSIEELFSVGINRAVTLIAEKKAGGGKGRFGRAASRTVLKDLGEHPSGGGKIEVLDGRYGPYVTHNKVNATIPKSKDPTTLTQDEAIALLEERIAKGGGKKPVRKSAAKADAKPKKKALAKKAAAKKPATKKSAARADAPKKAAAKKAPAKKGMAAKSPAGAD